MWARVLGRDADAGAAQMSEPRPDMRTLGVPSVKRRASSLLGNPLRLSPAMYALIALEQLQDKRLFVSLSQILHF